MSPNQDHCNARIAVIEDLLEEFQIAIVNKLTIILPVDFNENVNANALTNVKLREMGLFNVMEAYVEDMLR